MIKKKKRPILDYSDLKEAKLNIFKLVNKESLAANIIPSSVPNIFCESAELNTNWAHKIWEIQQKDFDLLSSLRSFCDIKELILERCDVTLLGGVECHQYKNEKHITQGPSLEGHHNPSRRGCWTFQGIWCVAAAVVGQSHDMKPTSGGYDWLQENNSKTSDFIWIQKAIKCCVQLWGLF